LGYPRSDTVLGFKGQRVSKFISHTTTAIHRHSLGGITSRLRLRGYLVRASLTFATWHCSHRHGIELAIECLLIIIIIVIDIIT